MLKLAACKVKKTSINRTGIRKCVTTETKTKTIGHELLKLEEYF